MAMEHFDYSPFPCPQYVNTHNCRIWATKNTIAHEPVPLPSAKVSVWFAITTSFKVQPFFFKVVGPVGSLILPSMVNAM